MASEEDTRDVSIEEEEEATVQVPSPIRIERGTAVAAVEDTEPSQVLTYDQGQRERSLASTFITQPAVVSPQAVRAPTIRQD